MLGPLSCTCISVYLLATGRDSRTCDCVVLGSVSQRGDAQVLCNRKPHSTGQGLLHSISVSSLKGKTVLFGRKDTLRGIRPQQEGKNPPDGGDEELLQQPSAREHEGMDHSVRTNN